MLLMTNGFYKKKNIIFLKLIFHIFSQYFSIVHFYDVFFFKCSPSERGDVFDRWTYVKQPTAVQVCHALFT